MRSEMDNTEGGLNLLEQIKVEMLETHKFDQYLPDLLIRKRAANDWIDWIGTKEWLYQKMS